MKLKNVLPLAMLMTCTLMAGAHADIKYTQTMTAGGGQNVMPMMQSVHFVAPGKERNETQMSMGNFKSKEAIVTICQPHQVIHIDNGLKIYANAGDTTKMPSMMGNRGSSHETSGTGKIAINVKVSDLKPEKVAGWNTKHYVVVMHIKRSGCLGNGTSDMKIELWVADIKNAHACKANVDYGAMLGRREGGKCKVSYQTTGDFARLGGIWNGLVMRQKMYNSDGKVMMTQEVTSLSQSKLNPNVFAIPAGYTKLSFEDYNKQRQHALMQSMMGRRQ